MNETLRRRNLYNLRVTPKRTRRRLAEKYKRYLRNKLNNPMGVADSIVTLEAPEQFNVRQTEYRAALIKLIGRMNKLVEYSHRSVQIDFSKTRQMFPGGTLLFAATVDRLVKVKRHGVTISCTYPRFSKVEEVLQQIGLLRLLGRSPRMPVSSEDVKYWKYITGLAVDSDKAGEFSEQHAGKIEEAVGRRLYAGIVEAMVNCKHHAYSESEEGGRNEAVKAWWMFSQERDNRLVVALCDLGIGIPNSLKNGDTWPEDVIRQLREKMQLGHKDAAYIKMALAIGKSSTHAEHRGNGLADLKRVVEATASGTMAIYSNFGLLEYSSEDASDALINFGQSIGGTLIHWTIPLGNQEE